MNKPVFANRNSLKVDKKKESMNGKKKAKVMKGGRHGKLAERDTRQT